MFSVSCIEIDLDVPLCTVHISEVTTVAGRPTTGGGSVVARRQLGVRLRQLRLAAGKDPADVEEAHLLTRSKLNRIENGRLPVKVPDVLALCQLYGTDQATVDSLTTLALGTQQEGYWEEYGPGAVPDWFGLYAGLEATASRIRTFEAELIPGLLQTADYATLVSSFDPRTPPRCRGAARPVPHRPVAVRPGEPPLADDDRGGVRSRVRATRGHRAAG